ncbi:GNAT family N-acetyltransferase [Streptomyces sp. NPDC055025]
MALSWQSLAENDVGPDRHAALNELFKAAFPFTVDQFPGRRSWAGARPELRVIATADGRPVAHAGILRRFLRIGPRFQLVGEVGLVAVHPGLQGTGLGRQLNDRVRTALELLDTPFGYLNCHPSVAGYYTAVGWHGLDGVVTRHYEPDDELTVTTTTAQPFVLPVGSPREAWPAGSPIERDGTEL